MADLSAAIQLLYCAKYLISMVQVHVRKITKPNFIKSYEPALIFELNVC